MAHHGSMHSAPLDVYEKMEPKVAIVSTQQEVSTKQCTAGVLTRGLFPHQSTTIALEECGAQLLTTDGCYESQLVDGGVQRNPAMAHPGSIVVVVPPGKKPRYTKLDDGADDVPNPPSQV